MSQNVYLKTRFMLDSTLRNAQYVRYSSTLNVFWIEQTYWVIPDSADSSIKRFLMLKLWDIVKKLPSNKFCSNFAMAGVWEYCQGPLSKCLAKLNLGKCFLIMYQRFEHENPLCPRIHYPELLTTFVITLQQTTSKTWNVWSILAKQLMIDFIILCIILIIIVHVSGHVPVVTINILRGCTADK